MDELEEIRKRRMEELKMSAEMPSEPIIITDQNFEETVKKYKVVVIDCWAAWCGPCKMLTPIIEELATEYQGKAVFGKLNTDENPKVPMKHNVMGIPNLLFYVDGVFIDSSVGVVPKESLKEMVDTLLT